MLYFGKTVLADQGNPGILLPDSSHIGSLSEETREESVADEGVLISLMAAFGHGVGKECYIHVFSVLVFALIRESHDTVQESVRALILTMKYAFQRIAAAVTLLLEFSLSFFGEACELGVFDRGLLNQLPGKFQYRIRSGNLVGVDI